jgi:hypothetical protein
MAMMVIPKNPVPRKRMKIVTRNPQIMITKI